MSCDVIVNLNSIIYFNTVVNFNADCVVLEIKFVMLILLTRICNILSGK